MLAYLKQKIHPPLHPKTTNLTLSLREGEGTKILFQSPKSFQAGHFRLKSFYKIFFFAECRAQISVNFSCVLNISTLQIPSKFGAHCPSNKLRKEKVGYITL